MSSSVIAVREKKDLHNAVAKANEDKKLLVLEFMGSATYTSTCEPMKQILEKIATEKKDNAYFYAIDVDSNVQLKEIADQSKVGALPTFLLIKDTKTVKRIVSPDEKELSSAIEAAKAA